MIDVLRETVLPKLDAVKKSGGGFMARCPVHEDRAASLSVAAGTTHPVVFHCHAGCTPEQICTAIGLDWSDLCKPREDTRTETDDWKPAGTVATYEYRDEEGRLLFQVLRTVDKKFLQRRPDPTARNGWTYKLGETRRVLYRLQKVIAAVAEGHMIWIVEGEKDVHTLEAQGLVATCNPGGAGKWRPEYSEHLREAVVMIVADNDKPGQAHARAIRDALDGIAADITVAEATAGKDVTDHLAAGLGLEELDIVWPTKRTGKPDLAPDIWEFLAAEDAPYDWLIPGLLERGDRLILTGFEGLGKSMLVRQLAFSAASGIHPFRTGYATDYQPVKVLFIDCENSEKQGRRKFGPVGDVIKNLGRPAPHGNLRVLHQPTGIDLTSEEDEAWLYERITAHQPDLLVVGPFYKLHDANANDEQIARHVVGVLDRARAISNAALITEAHAGHGEAGKTRAVRPTGSSLLLRWPEFGFGLAPNANSVPDEHDRCRQVDVISWRGARDEREWPRHLEYGGKDDLPWKPWRPPPPIEKGPKK